MVIISASHAQPAFYLLALKAGFNPGSICRRPVQVWCMTNTCLMPAGARYPGAAAIAAAGDLDPDREPEQ
jgi:hypothetical protein